MGWIDSIPLPAVELDRAGRVRAANELAGRLLERAGGDLVDVARADLPAEALRAAVEVPLAEGTLLLLPAGSAIESLKQQVFHLSRLASAGRLVAVVVHEINNSLSGILGYAQFLLEQPVSPEARVDLERIRDEALRTARVAQNLLRFARGGRRERSIVRVDELLRRCVELKQRDFGLRSIELAVAIEPGLPPLHADEALLSQVFINLLTNAQQSVSAARESGRIELRARRIRRHVVVDVIDDGPGIPARLRDRVFEPFFTGRAGSGGTGLGLTLCRDILRDHGAEIRVARLARPGACLRVSLPAAEVPALAPKAGPAPVVAAHVEKRRIVVVEDEPAVRDVVSRAFAGRGNHIITFERGEDALPYLVGEPVDLVVSDVRRPGVDGIELYDQLARLRPTLLSRMLFLTGDALDAEIAAFARRTRARVLRKPIRLEELQVEAGALLERTHNQGELFRTNGSS